MIRTFRHRGLERYFKNRDHRGIQPGQAARIRRLLDRLDAALAPEDMNLPGYGFHRLKGKRSDIYAVSVSGNWRITFKFQGEDTLDVNLEDYH